MRIKLDGKHIVVDGFDPQTHTIYEFWGTYYHGHPAHYRSDDLSYMGTSFGQLFAQTQKKINLIHEAGYNLVDIWEHEWRG